MTAKVLRARLLASTSAAMMIAGLCQAGGAAAQTTDPASPASPTSAAQSPLATPAQPAEPAAPGALEEVVVTGSRIPRAGFDTLQPAQTVSSETLLDRGFTNAGDALNELSAFGAAGSNNTGQQSGQNVGQQFVNLYGLGAQRTLVLVNGRRFVSGNAPTPPGTFGGPPPGPGGGPEHHPRRPDRPPGSAVGGRRPDLRRGRHRRHGQRHPQEQLPGRRRSGAVRRSRAKATATRSLGRVTRRAPTSCEDRGNVVATVEYSQQDGLTYADRPRTLPYATQQPSDACTALGLRRLLRAATPRSPASSRAASRR